MIASHIKPWRDSSNFERLDGNNGLLLAPHIDKLFDKGWITFTLKGDLKCSNPGIKSILLTWGVSYPKNVGAFSKKQEYYLDYHNKHIFKEY